MPKPTSKALAAEAMPMRSDVPPHTTEASPAAKVTLAVQAASMKRFHRRRQNVVTRLSNAKPPRENSVTVCAICPGVRD